MQYIDLTDVSWWWKQKKKEGRERKVKTHDKKNDKLKIGDEKMVTKSLTNTSYKLYSIKPYRQDWDSCGALNNKSKVYDDDFYNMNE